MMKFIRFENDQIAPSKVICVGRNYVEHIEELGNDLPEDMVIFLKPNSAVTDALTSFHGEPLHYELEIALLVKDNEYQGIGLGVDITKRALQTRLKQSGLPWERAKAFDRSAVLSDFVPIPDAANLESMHYTLDIDGNRVQHGYVANMLYKPAAILTECRSFLTLNDGDVIMTGTPKGVGTISSGARFNARLYDHSDAAAPFFEVTWLAV